MKVADAHADLSELENSGDVIHRAAQAGAFAITSMGMGLKSNLRTLQLSEEYKSSYVKILPALGLNPWRIAQFCAFSSLLRLRISSTYPLCLSRL